MKSGSKGPVAWLEPSQPGINTLAYTGNLFEDNQLPSDDNDHGMMVQMWFVLSPCLYLTIYTLSLPFDHHTRIWPIVGLPFTDCLHKVLTTSNTTFGKCFCQFQFAQKAFTSIHRRYNNSYIYRYIYDEMKINTRKIHGLKLQLWEHGNAIEGGMWFEMIVYDTSR